MTRDGATCPARTCKRRRRMNAPVPRCRYRGVGVRPSEGLTGRL
uniref:Uncharacterized protein n=1 Tax=Phage sp. ct4bw6 TaxID=2826747 RepID=A0A8S5MUX8_9VIRU|nr:MAG TPA: hypothetical protein [Phage sp. ct4bw6]